MIPRPIRSLTFLTDLLIINVAFWFAYYIRYDVQWLRPTAVLHEYSGYLGQQLLYNIFLIATFYQNKVWQRRRGEFWIDEVSRVVYATAIASALMTAYIFIFLPVPFSRMFWVWVPTFVVLFLGIGRLIRRLILHILYQRGIRVDRVLVVGAGESGRSLIRTLLARPDLGFMTIGYLYDQEHDESIGSGRIPNLGTLDELPRVLQKFPNLHTVFIALPANKYQKVLELIRICQTHGVEAQVAPDLFQLSLNQVESNNMGGVPMLRVREIKIGRTGQFLKRTIDLLVVLLGAIPASVVGVIIAVAIKLTSPGPIFYAGNRIGQDGKPFRMIKFRSMVVDAESRKSSLEQMNEREGPIFKIKDDPRLTRVGRVIRRLSLDELPQLINVLKGEMSLVGPRPPLPEEVVGYKPWHMQRLTVPGGITGLWQVSGRSDLTFDEQCLLDIYYIENWSLSLDIRILLQTIPYSLFGRGAY